MIHRGSILFRSLAALLILAGVFAAGWFIYRAGVTQGYAQAALLSQGEEAPAAPGFPYYGYWLRPHFGFFPGFPLFGFFLFGLLFLFLFGGFRRAFYGSRQWGHSEHWHTHPHAHPPTGEPQTGGEHRTEEGQDQA